MTSAPAANECLDLDIQGTHEGLGDALDGLS